MAAQSKKQFSPTRRNGLTSGLARIRFMEERTSTTCLQVRGCVTSLMNRLSATLIAAQLNFLRTLVIWSLGSSEQVAGTIKEKYKQQRHSDDENQPLSVQPWGMDGDNRRYFLIQGLDDTSFRIYREGSRYTRNAHWYSQAGTIDEAKALAEKLEKEDGSQKARKLAIKITNAVPMFEATEEKRNRRIYRQQRRAAFTRPEPGFGIYEGRTRGKRTRYTYDDEGGDDSDNTSTRRSTRHQSARSTPFETGPQYTASGRQIKQPRQGDYGESLLSTNVMSTDELGPDNDTEARSGRADSQESDPVQSGGRPSRGNRNVNYADKNPRKRKHIDGYNDIDAMSEEDDAVSGDEWNSDQNDDEMPDAPDVDSEPSEDEDDGLDDVPKSLVVKLKIPQSASVQSRNTPPTSPSVSGEKDTAPGCAPGPTDEKIASTTTNGEAKLEATKTSVLTEAPLALTSIDSLTPTSPRRSPQVVVPAYSTHAKFQNSYSTTSMLNGNGGHGGQIQ